MPHSGIPHKMCKSESGDAAQRIATKKMLMRCGAVKRILGSNNSTQSYSGEAAQRSTAKAIMSRHTAQGPHENRTS